MTTDGTANVGVQFVATLLGDHGGSCMFERYTDRARRSIDLAQNAARDANHAGVGPEHILVGLVTEGEGVAFRALNALGVTSDMVREATLRHHPAGTQSPGGYPPFTGDAKKACEFALRAAIELGHNYIGTEHLLLGLVRFAEISPDVPGSKALASLGIGDGDKGFASDVREKVLELLRGYGTIPAATESDAHLSLDATIAMRARSRAAEAAEDAAECARRGTIAQARELLAEAGHHLDWAEKHEQPSSR